MPAMVNLESDLTEPIRFFLLYHRGGRNILERQYKVLDDPELYYDRDKHVVMVYVETLIDEDVTETSWEEYQFENYIRDRFEEETQKSIQLITETYRSKGNSENAFAYKRLLRAFDRHFERLKNYLDYPECELLPSSLLEIVSHAIKQYDQFYDFDLIAKVKKKIKSEDIVKTGYKIKGKYWPRIPGFNDALIEASFIDPKTTVEQWHEFFRGEFPKVKIKWIVDSPSGHLWYFIKKIKDSEILVAFPKQQYKYLDRIFTFNDDAVPERFYDNHYLREESKEILNKALDILKS